MIGSFFRNFLELPERSKNIVCLGGGVGTSRVLKGLRAGPNSLTAVVSMADDGGSAGRLRRAFSIPPPGDLVTCLAALSDEESILKDLFIYRFSGKRYGKDTDLGGHKLGNLIFVALTDIFHGDTNRALVEFSKIVSPKGIVLPATLGDVNIWAKTKGGKKVYGEENIDLGKYDGGRSLSEVHLNPPNIKAYKPTVEALKDSDVIIVGPGDLFSTVLPVLIVPSIKNLLLSTTALKIFIVNVANKPFETAGFRVSDYLSTLKSHLTEDIFDKIVINTNHLYPIPKNLDYQYVSFDKKNLDEYEDKIEGMDLVDRKFPIYHDSVKLSRLIEKLIL